MAGPGQKRREETRDPGEGEEKKVFSSFKARGKAAPRPTVLPRKGGGSSIAAEDFIILLRTIVPLKQLKFRLAFICDE